MRDILIWWPRSYTQMAKILYSLKGKAEIWTSSDYGDIGGFDATLDYWLSVNMIENDYVPKFSIDYVSDAERAAWCDLYEAPPLTRLSFDRVRDLELVLHDIASGANMFFASDYVSRSDLYAYVSKSKFQWWPTGLLREQFECVKSLSDYTAWFGVPDGDGSENVVVISRNNEAQSRFLSVLGDVVDNPVVIKMGHKKWIAEHLGETVDVLVTDKDDVHWFS